jgi:hypothetical protein
MSDFKIYRLTGICGLAVVLFSWSQFPLYTMFGGAAAYDDEALSQHLYVIKNIALTRILLDLCLYVAGMVFAAGFRHLIRQVRADYEWIGTLMFGTFMVWVTVTLVADGLQGGAVLDTLGGKPNLSAVRALHEGTLLIYNGSTAFAITAIFLAVSGYATFGTNILPQWTGWLAYVGALLCVACIPAMYFGPINYEGFYNAGGWGPAIIANFPPLIWFLVVSVIMIKKSSQR